MNSNERGSIKKKETVHRPLKPSSHLKASIKHETCDPHMLQRWASQSEESLMASVKCFFVGNNGNVLL